MYKHINRYFNELVDVATHKFVDTGNWLVRLLPINFLLPILSFKRHIYMWACGSFPLFHYKIGSIIYLGTLTEIMLKLV